MAELDLLAKLFDKAERIPDRLKSYALGQMEQIVLTGNGPTRDGGSDDGAGRTIAGFCGGSCSRSRATTRARSARSRPTT